MVKEELMVTIRRVWNRIAKGRYTRGLEGEVARLRAENRALLNSILGIAGIPPIVVSSIDPDCASAIDTRPEEAKGVQAAVRRSAASSESGIRANGAARRRRMVDGPMAVRHRSWQQVNRMLEFDAMRKREQGSSEPLRAGIES
jgi:hypothetical protein